MKKILFASVAIFLLAAGCGKQPNNAQNNQPAPTPTVTPTATPTPSVTPTPSPTPPVSIKGKVYETAYFKITVPDGWTAKEAIRVVYESDCVNKQPCAQTKKTLPNPAAVNITKGKYILYINTQTTQASGVEGGRFEEFAGGAPSVDALIVEHPGGPCDPAEQTVISSSGKSISRYDYFVSASSQSSTCRKVTSQKPLWYFSSIGGGINYYVINGSESTGGWVATLAYNSKVVNSFPAKDSNELSQMLKDMTNIYQTLEIKDLSISGPVWKEQILEQFGSLTDWSYHELSDWMISSLDPKVLTTFGKAKVFELLKSFNKNGELDYSSKQADLEKSIKQILLSNGWQYTAGPTEGSFYNDYLYVKGNRALILEIGSRDAVAGGMYVGIEFQY